MDMAADRHGLALFKDALAVLILDLAREHSEAKKSGRCIWRHFCGTAGAEGVCWEDALGACVTPRVHIWRTLNPALSGVSDTFAR